MPAETFTTQQISDRLAVGVPVVLSWIHAGELAAVNVARSPRSKRPTWRVTAGALAAFEAARTATPVPVTRRRKRAAGDVIAFY